MHQNCLVMAHLKLKNNLEADLNNLKFSYQGDLLLMLIPKLVWMMTCMMDNAFSL